MKTENNQHVGLTFNVDVDTLRFATHCNIGFFKNGYFFTKYSISANHLCMGCVKNDNILGLKNWCRDIYSLEDFDDPCNPTQAEIIIRKMSVSKWDYLDELMISIGAGIARLYKEKTSQDEVKSWVTETLRSVLDG